MHGLPIGSHSHGHRHVAHLEFVHSFHAEFRKGHHSAGANGIGHQECRPAHGNQISGPVLGNGRDRFRSSFCFAHHGEQSRLTQHGVGESVHAIRGGGTRGTDDLRAHRIHRPHVVNDPSFEVQALGQGLAGI